MDRSDASAHVSERRADGHAVSRATALEGVDLRPAGPSDTGCGGVADVVLFDGVQRREQRRGPLVMRVIGDARADDRGGGGLTPRAFQAAEGYEGPPAT